MPSSGVHLQDNHSRFAFFKASDLSSKQLKFILLLEPSSTGSVVSCQTYSVKLRVDMGGHSSSLLKHKKGGFLNSSTAHRLLPFLFQKETCIFLRSCWKHRGKLSQNFHLEASKMSNSFASPGDEEWLVISIFVLNRGLKPFQTKLLSW